MTDVQNTTSWVTPPTPIQGRDHLGAQAPCVALYAELLPGITNTTTRARYFSFHPWFIWSFEQRYSDHSEPSYTREVRRADCLMTLIATRHRDVSNGPTELHDTASVGNSALGAAYSGMREVDAIQLDEFAALDGEKRYFKARWGGLGQYYFGSLVDLRLIDYIAGRNTPPGYDKTRGLAVAKAFDASVPAARFFEVLRTGCATREDLDALSPFCMCRLKENAAERDLLLDVFLARRPDVIDDGRDSRRDTLGLLLEIVRVAQPKDIQWALRPGAYSGALPVRTAWVLPPRLERARRRWAVYHQTELLSVAVQGLFWAILQALHIDRRGRLKDVSAAGDVLVDIVRKTSWGKRLAATVREAVEASRAALPPVGAWDDPEHEHERACAAERVAQRSRPPDEGLGPTVEHCIAVLVALLARESDGVSGSPYADFDLPPDRFGGDEIDLVSLRQQQSGWMELTLEAWVRWVAETWCVRRHFQVALRKLRTDRRDTFRLRPLDDELRLVDIAPAVFTGPRVDNAQHLLLDLGLIERDATTGHLLLTDLGARELKAIHG